MLPATAPVHSSRRLGSRWTRITITSAARMNLSWRKARVGYCVIASLTRTKVHPQTAVTATRRRTKINGAAVGAVAHGVHHAGTATRLPVLPGDRRPERSGLRARGLATGRRDRDAEQVPVQPGARHGGAGRAQG